MTKVLRNINLRANSGRIILYATLLKLVDTMLQLTAVRYGTGMGIPNYETRCRGIVSFITGVDIVERTGKLSYLQPEYLRRRRADWKRVGENA